MLTAAIVSLSGKLAELFILLSPSRYCMDCLQARHHFLVMPRESIANLKALKPEHLPLLKHMQKKGEQLAAR